MKHLSDSQLSARLDGVLSGSDLDRVKSHLSGCAECRSRLEALTEEERALRRALEHDPGEAYFAKFADRVQGRLRAEGLVGAQAHERGRLAGWFGRPRNLAIAGATAAVIVGAGIVMITLNEVEPPSLHRSEIAHAPGVSGTALKQQAPSATDSIAPSATASPSSGEVAPSDAGAITNEAKPSAGAEAAPEVATPQRAYEVRRDANGEDVPVNPPRPFLSPLPPVTSPEPEVSGPRVIKQRRAEPMGVTPLVKTSPAPTAQKDATPAPTPQRQVATPAPTGAPSGPDTPTLKVGAAPTASVPAPATTGAALAPPTPGAPAADTRGRARNAPPLPSPHTITSPSLAAREQSAPAQPQPAKRSLAIDEQQATGTELCGQVLDNLGRGVSHADVSIAETGTSTRADARGHFCIRAPAGDRTVVVMAVGFEELRRPVRVEDNGEELAMVLRPVTVPSVSPGSGTLGFTAAPPASGPSAGFSPNSKGETRAPEQQPAQPALDKSGRGGTAASPRMLYGTGPVSNSLEQAMAEAQKVSEEAARKGSVSHFEAAAGAWERVMPFVRGSSAEDDVRFHVAEQKFLAWQAKPSHSRSQAAHTALTAFVLRAPGGPQRDRAARMLAALKP